MKEYWNMFVSKNYLETTLMNSYWFLEQVQHDHNMNTMLQYGSEANLGEKD